MYEPARKVPVRIAVAVDVNGYWSAAGNCCYDSDDDAMVAAVDYLPEESSPQRHVVWIEAQVPLPRGGSIKGQVVRGELSSTEVLHRSC